MASGVAIDNDVKLLYNKMKSQKQYSYMILKLSPDKKMIVTDCMGDVDSKDKMEHYEEFRDKLQEAADNKECRYAVYDFKYENKNKSMNQKLVFFLWNPDNASIKDRMVYASSKDALGKALEEGKKFEQANDMDDLSREYWCNELRRLDRA